MPECSSQKRYTMTDLLYLMARLRDPEAGCPWDLEQTPQSIINYSIEEVYELAEVVEASPLDITAFKDELGDVLLQVVFMSQFAQEQQAFAFDDVVNQICEKMLRRHPHVFPDGTLYGFSKNGHGGSKDEDARQIDVDEVKRRWEEIKQQEKGTVSESVFNNIPLQLPALTRAMKFQKKASKFGLDWNDYQGPLEKIREELVELEHALADRNTTGGEEQAGEHSIGDAIDEELGDLLFSAVNLARKLGKNPEQLLRASTHKFAERVESVVGMLERDGYSPEGPDLSAVELDAYWREAKNK